MNTSNAFDKLIDACIDDERMLEHESRRVQGHRRAVLEGLAAERARSAERLRALGGGDARPHHGSWTELGRELGRWIRASATGPNDGDAVAACRRSCSRTEARFDVALDLPWSDAIRALLVEERAGLDEARDRLIAIEY